MAQSVKFAQILFSFCKKLTVIQESKDINLKCICFIVAFKSMFPHFDCHILTENEVNR